MKLEVFIFLEKGKSHRLATITPKGMDPVNIELDQEIVAVLEELHRPVQQLARELIVLELYRQGELSSGKAAQLLKLEREDFIRRASAQGIPYAQLWGEELRLEFDASKKL